MNVEMPGKVAPFDGISAFGERSAYLLTATTTRTRPVGPRETESRFRRKMGDFRSVWFEKKSSKIKRGMSIPVHVVLTIIRLIGGVITVMYWGIVMLLPSIVESGNSVQIHFFIFIL